MTKLPRKARSELVLPRNFSDGLVFDTMRMFQSASAASHIPARRPTRGSGLGAAADALATGAGEPPPEEVEGPQAAAERSAKARVWCTDRMTGSSSEA